MTPELICLPHLAPNYFIAPKGHKDHPGPGGLPSDEVSKNSTEVIASILKYNIGRNRVGGAYLSDSLSELNSPSGDFRRFKIFQLLEEKNCTFSWAPEEQENPGNPFSFNFGEMVTKGLSGIEPLLVAYGAQEFGLLDDQFKLTSYDPDDNNHLVRKTVYKYSPASALFPNQLKILTVPYGPDGASHNWFNKQELEPGQWFTTGLNWSNLAQFIIQHMLIVQVQACIGFSEDTSYINEEGDKSPTWGRSLMKNPIWVPLNESLVESYNPANETGLENPERPLLCRLVPYRAEFVQPKPGPGQKYWSFEFKPIKSLQLPIYNEHFMITF